MPFGTLQFLSKEKLIQLRNVSNLGKNLSAAVTFREKLFAAVDSNFGEITDVAPYPPDKTVLGLHTKAYREILVRDFSKNELKNLCLDLHIEYEDLGSDDTLSGRIRELIQYCRRHGRFLGLLITTAKIRPNKNWNELRN